MLRRVQQVNLNTVWEAGSGDRKWIRVNQGRARLWVLILNVLKLRIRLPEC
jgi:hypothetical protein